MTNAFISYRRADSSGYTGRLRDRLAEYLGPNNVFMDVSSIDIGTVFTEEIEKAILSCDAFIAVIGKKWIDITDDNGKRRLDDPNDYVCKEIEAAFANDVLVIPVLVDGAQQPNPDELPASIRQLTNLVPHRLDHAKFDQDFDILIDAILFNSLKKRLIRKQWPDADRASINIIRAISGYEYIDNSEKARAIPDKILVKLYEMWSKYGNKNLKDRAWVRIKEEGVTSYTGLFSTTTWLEKRLKEVMP